MQDRYAGDVGDFLTFGLLRRLVGPGPAPRPNRLGVVWYLVPDETHNHDGKHISYLAQDNPGRALRALDADLYDRLADLVRSGNRSVEALEHAGVLPVGSETFCAPLSLAHLAPSASRERGAHRRAWLTGALRAVADSELVFVGPDNGVRRSNHPVPRHRRGANKYAYYDELLPFVSRGQSLVAYQHADRSAPVATQARRRLGDAAEELGLEPLAAVQGSRGSARLLLVLPLGVHRPVLEDRLEELERSPWAGELTVHWWR